MADTELGELYGTTATPRRGASALVGLAGALTSLALVAGVGIWGYKLIMRDANGVPVVRALEGPMRIEPEDPGGDRMAHQGLAVNQVAAAGEAGEIAEELTLAPAAPALLDQDLPPAELAAAPTAQVAADPAADPAAPGQMAAQDDMLSATDVAVLAVLAEAAREETDAAPEAEAAPGPDAIPASVQGVARSPVPRPRPAHMIHVAAPAVAVTPAAASVAAPATVQPAVARADDVRFEAAQAVEMPADQLPVGARLVQLGAFDSPETARSEWDRIAKRFSSVMAGKERVIQEASAGGKTFYRLRAAGFTDLADARRFCATLTADPTKPLCVPVAAR